MKKINLLQLFFYTFFFISLYSQKYNILLITDTFPCNSKSAIMNQIKHISRTFSLSIHSKNKSDLTCSPEILNSISNITYGNLCNCETKNIDLVLCQYGSLGKEYAAHITQSKKMSCKRIVTFFRGSDITSKKEIEQNQYNLLFKLGLLFVPVCYYYEYLLKILGCNPSKIVVVPSSIDCSLFKYREKKIAPQKPIKIISVNRLVEKKGVYFCIKALHKLIKKEKLNVHYTIVGSGNQEETLSLLVKKLDIADHVTFLGHRDHSEIPQLLRKSDIFLSAPVTISNGSQEGIPNAVKEAMAVGLPVISTYHAGIKELIKTHKSGILVPERDSKALSEALKYLITHQKQWPKITRYARKTVKDQYDITNVNKILENEILHILSKSM